MQSYRFAVAYITIFIIIAHLVVGEPYLWYRNSISQLAGQAYPYAWIMRLGFIGYGVLIQIAGISRIRAGGRYRYREIPIMLYGLAILLTGVFSAEPFVEGVPYSEREAQLHGLIASVAGVFLSTGILLYMLTDTPDSRRVVHTIALVLVVGIAAAFFALPALAGALQRLLWVVGFVWLVYLGSGTTPSQEEG